MPNKSISTMQAATPLTGATLLLVSLNPVKILSIEGTTNSTTTNSYYIQLLGTSAPVSGTTVPLYSRLCVQSSTASGVNGFSFVYEPDGLDTALMRYPVNTANANLEQNTLPVYAAISSTDGVWTSVVASTDVTVTIEQSYVPPTNATYYNVAFTGEQAIIWVDPNASNRLVTANWTNGTGAIAYLMLYGNNPSVAGFGSTPLKQWTVGIGATINLDYGNQGIQIQQGDTSYVEHYGCYFIASSTPLVLNPVASANNITGYYLTGI